MIDRPDQKEREHDFKTPEGRYFLARRNTRSDFFLAIQVSYPNKQDEVRARKNRWAPGGSIMIHGFPNQPKHPAAYYDALVDALGLIEVVVSLRTHLMDAVPLTVGQEWSGWAHQIRDALERIRGAEGGLLQLAAGATAVGTGLNAPPNFSRDIATQLAALTGFAFITAPNKFTALGSLDAMVAAMSAVRGLAIALMTKMKAPQGDNQSSHSFGNPTYRELRARL